MNTKYAGLIKNDMINGEGVCVSFWTQGCPHKCPGCHNPETWDYDKGMEVPTDIKEQIIKAISANGIKRNFSVLGGEPLCEENLLLTKQILLDVKLAYPYIKTFLWTGYTLENLSQEQKEVLKYVDTLIDGLYCQELRDITLKLRGSSNQRVLKKGIDF